MLLLLTNQSTPIVLTPVSVFVYQSARKSTSGVNFSDTKTTTDAAREYYIPNNGHVGFMTQSVSDGEITVHAQVHANGLAINNLKLPLIAGKIQIWGTFSPSVYNTANGEIVITTDVQTDIIAFRLS